MNLDSYRHLADAEWLRASGLFVAEGRFVVRRVLQDAPDRVRSLLLTGTARAALGDALDRVPAGRPVFVVALEAMQAITGFNIHRGCLALVDRPASLDLASLVHRLGDARLVLALEEVANADNVGGAFRNALAFGAGAVVLSPGCCDPLYRKAIRTSMGATLGVPFARAPGWPRDLDLIRAAGFALVALTPAAGARDLAAFVSDPDRPSRVALAVGTEGAGLSAAVEAMADARVRIPMMPGVDSLNLATAAGIALQRIHETFG